MALNIRGLFQQIFGKGPRTPPNNFSQFRLLSSWDSSFTPFSGNAWDISTVRAAIDAWARNAAVIQPRHIKRTEGKREDVPDHINRILQTRPNPYMTAYAFYYKVAAQYKTYNNAFILPVFENGRLKTAKSMGVYDTGVTEGSIKKTKVKKTATGKSIDIFPQGVNSDGNRNAEVAFINEFGKSGKHGKKGQPARPFIRTANEAAEERATEAEEKVYNDFLNGKNL